MIFIDFDLLRNRQCKNVLTAMIQSLNCCWFRNCAWQCLL